VGTRIVDERSMDETALLAFGILLEEASREALGARGDLVFTEPSTEPAAVPKSTQAANPPSMAPSGPLEDGEMPTVRPPPRSKRRKVAKDDSQEAQPS
jgi:hypothetical protein